MLSLGGLIVSFVLHGQPVKTASTGGSPLQALTFLSGRWTETSADGDEEEYWSEPMASSMVGTFRIVRDGKPVFYEFWAIEIENGKPVFKLKHFSQGLTGWEEKASMVRLETTIDGLQQVTSSKPDGTLSLRYRRSGNDLVCTLHELKAGKASDEVFHLHRSSE